MRDIAPVTPSGTQLEGVAPSDVQDYMNAKINKLDGRRLIFHTVILGIYFGMSGDWQSNLTVYLFGKTDDGIYNFNLYETG